ncbi:hypothetical protein LX32DRAFT_692641 [Colletotrichum zoysiae]|uniref:Uncharacterized protein n=1 Tax=Colletotrichum zoysiae TaxID=1216348 RepID=A0AAD9HL46_9PEZI|nr:hypothetical protein LX32DRAFT_692641 [Colletotrichum zoysiae]
MPVPCSRPAGDRRARPGVTPQRAATLAMPTTVTETSHPPGTVTNDPCECVYQAWESYAWILAFGWCGVYSLDIWTAIGDDAVAGRAYRDLYGRAWMLWLFRGRGCEVSARVGSS